jgi:hypothetical protein
MKTTRPTRLDVPRLAMPKFAQVTGMIVTSIVVFGADTDILLAIPMGILAGSLATFFVSLSEYKDAGRRL